MYMITDRGTMISMAHHITMGQSRIRCMMSNGNQTFHSSIGSKLPMYQSHEVHMSHKRALCLFVFNQIVVMSNDEPKVMSSEVIGLLKTAWTRM